MEEFPYSKSGSGWDWSKKGGTNVLVKGICPSQIPKKPGSQYADIQIVFLLPACCFLRPHNSPITLPCGSPFIKARRAGSPSLSMLLLLLLIHLTPEKCIPGTADYVVGREREERLHYMCLCGTTDTQRPKLRVNLEQRDWREHQRWEHGTRFHILQFARRLDCQTLPRSKLHSSISQVTT